MNWPRTLMVGVVAGLLLGLPALVQAQRPGEGTAGGGGGGGGAPASGAGGVAAGSSGSPGGASPSAGSMGNSSSGGSSGGFSTSGGNAGFNGPSSSGGSYSGGASSAARPRDEVFQRPGFADVYGNRAIGRNESAPPAGAEAPWYSRPRGNAPATGTATLRTDYIASHPPGGGGGGNPGWDGGGYYPGYPGYPAYYPGYGHGWGGNYGWYMYPGAMYRSGGYPDCGYGAYGMGYFYYNPFGWNYYGNCGYYGAGLYGAPGFYGAEYGAQGQGYLGAGGASIGYGQYQSRGGLRLKVKPADARVYIDGYFAGKVDQFDGSFQKLSLERGTHKIEISAPGYKPLVFEIDITSFDTKTWEGNLEKIVEQIK